ncbi:MAG: amidohydrolase family protein, partial [Acidobacteriota bacterium]
RANRLLGAKTAIVHGIPLRASDFEAMRQARTSLVWSPRSNIALYGQTADVGAALDAGVRVALAPDWAVTGSSNLLEELHFAAQWNVEHLSSLLSDQQMVAMVTSIPAQIAGVDDEVGAIRPGLYADLLVISGNRSVPARAMLEARAKDVQLVLVGGQPLYGAPKLMERYWERSELDAVNAGGAGKVVKLPARVGRMRELEARLQKALVAEGTQLTPSP